MRRRLSEAIAPRHLVLAGIVLVAFAVRAYGLGAESLWVDEIHTARVVEERTLGEIAFVLPEQDPHPPLYYLLLVPWTEVFGTSAAGLRSLSVALDLASIPLLYAVATRLFDREVGLVATLLFALSPFYVWYGREARMYALVVFLGLTSFYCLLALWQEDARWWRGRGAYVLATVALCYTHALAPLYVLAQNVLVADGVFRTRSVSPSLRLQPWLGLQFVVGAAIAPYYVLLFVRTFAQSYFVGFVSWLPAVSPGLLWAVFGGYVGRALPPSSPIRRPSVWPPEVAGVSPLAELVTLAALAVVAYAALGHVRDGARSSPAGVPFLAAWAAVPVASMYLLSELVMPVLFDRYTALAGVAVLILLARGLTALPRTRRETAAVVAVVVLVLAVPVATIHADAQKQQWEEAVGTVEGGAEDGDLVVVDPQWATDSYDYHATRDDLSVAGVRAGVTPAQFRSATVGRESVWLVVSQPTDRQLDHVETVATAAGYEIDRRERYTGVAVYRLERR